MPRRRPKAARKGKENSSRDRLSLSGYLYEADIKITDFADNPAAKLPTRIRKKGNRLQYDRMQLLPELSAQSQPQGMRKLFMEEDDLGEVMGGSNRQNDDDNDLNWDEKNWDDDGSYDLEDGTSQGSSLLLDDSFDELEEEGNIKKTASRKGSKKKRSAQTWSDVGVVYPPDLWFVLANYIQPTDIGTFATLCMDAYWATRTATFWRKLYHRSVNQSVQLPSHLQPSSLKRVAGLRATVIKALYITHEPYKKALNNVSPVGDGKYSPEAVTNYTCLYTWSRGKLGGHFTHFLKMRDCAKPCKIPAGSMGHAQAALHENPDSRDCVVRIHCASFQDVPLARIMGQQLVRSSVSVGADMRYHRLKLVFGRLDRRGTGVPSSLVTVSLDPVIRMEVLHWWHPQFSESSRPSIDRAITENLVNAREDRFWEGL